jgi:RNA polymerase sigma factor for flagellar operon FliA
MSAAKQYESAMQVEAVDRDQLIQEMLVQVKYIARRIHERLPQHVPFDDLVQAGVVGLLDAVNKFDPSKNTQLKTYAKFRIRGAILDSLRECDWGPRDLRRQARQVEDTQSRLRNTLGRAATEEEISAELGLGLTEYHELLGTLHGLTLGSLEDSTEHEGAHDELATYVPYAPEQDPFFLCAKGEMKEILMKALEDLPKKEREVLVLYYYEELTLREVGEVLGVVESRVSQLRSAALTRLRARMQDLLSARPTPASARNLTKEQPCKRS